MIINMKYILKSLQFSAIAYDIVDRSFWYYGNDIISETTHNENISIAEEILKKSDYYFLLGNPQEKARKRTLFI